MVVAMIVLVFNLKFELYISYVIAFKYNDYNIFWFINRMANIDSNLNYLLISSKIALY